MRSTPVLPIKFTIWRWFKCKRTFKEFNLLFVLSIGKDDKTFLLSSSVNWPFRKRQHQRLTSEHRHLLLWIPFFAWNANVTCEHTLNVAPAYLIVRIYPGCEDITYITLKACLHEEKVSLFRSLSSIETSDFSLIGKEVQLIQRIQGIY